MQASRPLVVYSCHRPQTGMSVRKLLALKPADIYSLGDDVYLEQVFGSTADPFYGRYSDSVSAPDGSGCRVQIGAAVGGALPVGAATVLAPGSNYPAGGPTGTLVACTISAFFIPLTGLAPGQTPASGRLTTNSSRQVASITVDFGGDGYTNAGAAEFTVVASCDALFWLLKFDHQKADEGWRYLYARRAAGDFRVFSQFDDHELISNLTFATADLTSRTGGSSPWWESQGGQAPMLAFWRTASAGFDLIRQSYYDNPPPSGNSGGDIPAGLVGAPGVTADDFPVRYHAQDYGPNMERGGTALRVIHLDTMSYTSAYNAVDDGNGLTGKTKLGKTQVQWLLNQLRDAKSRGMAAVVLSPKDLGNVDNGDSWRGTGGGALGYVGELNYLLGRIEAEDLPVAAWLGGDRHQPHVALFDTRNGDAGTLLSVCPCPYGADPAGLTAYPQNIWTNRDLDAAVFGTISLLPGAVRVQIVDAHDPSVELFGADIAFGQRRPYAVRGAQQLAAKPRASLIPEYVYMGGWAGRPTSGLSVRARAYFTDVGVNGSDWLWDGVFWSPAAPVVLFRECGSLAAPIATLTGVASGVFKTPGSVPAGMFVKPGMRLNAMHDIRRTSATAVGTVMSTLGGAWIASTTLAATVNQDARGDSNLLCVSSAVQVSQGGTPPNSQGTGGMQAGANNYATAQAYALQLSSANVADTFQLIGYSLTLYP